MNHSQTLTDNHPCAPGFDRRAFLVGGGVALTALGGYLHWSRKVPRSTPVFVAKNQRYDASLERTIQDGLSAVGFQPSRVRGKRVLLKPNLVEPSKDCPQMTTHPMMVAAAAAVFRRWGADVIVGEGPGHVRDTEQALIESGMLDVLRELELEFIDLNYDDVTPVKNVGGASELTELFLPRAVTEAEVVVSMPKLKTHHWMGLTAAMKNLYGVFPGIKYGWPKNVLHHAGIPQTVFDVNAALPNTVAVVDGIVCMEGDGPIMGTAKPMGIVAVGMNTTAVDATCARIMGLAPERIAYLRQADRRLGPLNDKSIEQRGESWRELVSPFEILNFPHLQQLRAENPGVLTS